MCLGPTWDWSYGEAENHKMDGFLSEKRNPGWAMSFLEDDLRKEFSFIRRSLAPSSG